MKTAICPLCGVEFVKTNNRQKYCRQIRYSKCSECGKDIEYVCGENIPSTCSMECYKNMMHNYNIANNTPEKNKARSDKAKATMLERYGAISYTGTYEYKEKVRNTCLEKYGVDHHLKAKEVIDKRNGTVKEKYGVDNVFQSDEVKQKIAQTNVSKFGVANPGASKDVQTKVKEHNMSKYGVEHPMMLKEYQDKAKHTNEIRYGRRAFTQQHICNIVNWYAFIDNPRGYIDSHYVSPPRSKELAQDLGVDVTQVDLYLAQGNAQDCIRRAKSQMEEDIIAFIRSIDSTIRIISNDKTVIKPLELDIYLPDYKFAIECNPTATHNSSVSDPWGGEPKHRNYHKNKTDICERKGIQLFHIFGYEWKHSKDIILSMITNNISRNSFKIYARNCYVREVSSSDSRLFLDKNHRQGYVAAPIQLGLYCNCKLVSLMTFGKMRKTIGLGKTDLSECYELVRFCSKLDTTVVGGASKLFNYFVKAYSPTRIRSFSDRAHTSGKLYSQLGFVEVSRSDSSYVWVNAASDVAYHRINAQKRNISKFLKDDRIDLSDTETNIMIEHGYVQVFDSGTITWEWQCDK